jgi:hypothetical protein
VVETSTCAGQPGWCSIEFEIQVHFFFWFFADYFLVSPSDSIHTSICCIQHWGSPTIQISQRESLPRRDSLYSQGHGSATSESETKQFTVPDPRVIVVLSQLQGDLSITYQSQERIHTLQTRRKLWTGKKRCGSAII